MTDLISSLADELVALNNSSPHLPRKEQIEELLRKHAPALASAPVPSDRAAWFPKITTSKDAVTGNLLVTAAYDDVTLGYAVTLAAIGRGSVFDDIVDMNAKLEDSVWQALHCNHVWGPSPIARAITVCTHCGRGKP